MEVVYLFPYIEVGIAHEQHVGVKTYMYTGVENTVGSHLHTRIESTENLRD